ncbi:MAG: hypothetical protein H0U26_06860, partial [Acidimicrobiia bacterium]|nr:hypothetical protein [Acidimicrobiia bacterium]
PRLLLGLVVMGAGIGSMAAADLGLGPWDVLHQGIARHTGLGLGALNILVGLVVLTLWVPLRQRLGVGTVLNTIVVGLAVDATLALLSTPSGLPGRWALMVAGVLGMALGSGLYIGAGLGPGPRDGLMTGLAARGHSIRSVRTAMEGTVLVLGWALGGTVGVGTVVLALTIGPLVQAFLGLLTLPPVRLRQAGPSQDPVENLSSGTARP